MDDARLQQTGEVLRREGYTALLCRLPQNVVMLTGYQPILGNSFCLATVNEHGEVTVRMAAPEDEAGRVPGWVTSVHLFREETMEYISNTIQAVKAPLDAMLREAFLTPGSVVGYEGVYSPVATAYAQVGVPGPATLSLLTELLPHAGLRDAHALLQELAAIKTRREIQAIRRAESVAFEGFAAARGAVRVGLSEADVAGAALSALVRAGYAKGASHLMPFVHVMAGIRSADAYRAYNLTSANAIERGDPVCVQIEVAVDGYFCELTRTFFAGEASDDWRRAHDACIRAQDAAKAVIRDGTPAREADAAARQVMEQRGFGPEFRHGLGHGFGFQAINHAAEPVLHPASDSILRTGMVHNMEPAVYREGVGGMRLNDNVLVTESACELLSRELPRDLDWLIVRE